MIHATLHQGRRDRTQRRRKTVPLTWPHRRPADPAASTIISSNNQPGRKFDRKKDRGMRLDSPDGTAVRSSTGKPRRALVALAGKRVVYGYRGGRMGNL